MTPIFVDTHHFVASFQETDQWHDNAILIEKRITGRRFVTTDSVLIELLNYFSGFGPITREKISLVVRDVMGDDNFTVIEQKRSEMLKALKLYESRLDKGYSLIDCISMNVCRELGIREILTHDDHFKQEGFQILL